jgi:CBS domain-containing protein
MFAVYGVTGRVFSGTPEQLRQAGAVGSAARTRATQRKEPGGEGGSASSESADGAQRSAIAAYAQTQRGSVERQPLTRVEQLMSRNVVTVAHDATVAQAWQLLSRRGMAQAPVVDGVLGTLVGLLLRADLLPSLDAGPQAWAVLLGQKVADHMWTPVPGVAADTDIRRVAQVLLDTGLPGLPVTEDSGTVSGFVSRSDILRAVVADPPLDLWG